MSAHKGRLAATVPFVAPNALLQPKITGGWRGAETRPTERTGDLGSSTMGARALFGRKFGQRGRRRRGAAVTPNSRGSDAWQQTAGVSAEAGGEGDSVAIRRTMQRRGDDGNDVPAEER